jgi:septum formation protein
VIVLASRSVVRVKLLRDAGVSFDADAADLDEDALVAGIADPKQQAVALARAKALHVAQRHEGVFVVGGDQVGVFDDAPAEAGPRAGTNLEKPRDREHHIALLLAMSGRRHRFHPAVCLVKDDAVLAEACDVVKVTFRAFDRATAAAYVDSGEGQGSCGGYEIEHRGAQLVERVDGSLQAVLGFPLLMLLPLLRAHCAGEAGLLP